jgi:hypothetical protein
MMNVIKAERHGSIIVHTMDNGEQIRYAAIRGGISWPLLSENVPAYYCIVGEEHVPELRFEGQPTPRGKLRFICEYAAPDIYLSLSGFFSRLTDDVTLLLCNDFFGVTESYKGEDFSGYVEAMQNSTYENKVSVNLQEAPWAEKQDIGLLHVMNWQKKCLLDIPADSILYEQIKQLQPEDLKQIETLQAVNAFRFVISAFEKNRPTGLSGFVPNRRFLCSKSYGQR